MVLQAKWSTRRLAAQQGEQDCLALRCNEFPEKGERGCCIFDAASQLAMVAVCRGASVDQQHAEAKYGEISLTEKPPFTRGEGSVNEMFPNMSEAAHLQSNTAEDQATANARLSKDMRAQGGSKDEELESNLHNKGP